MTLLKIITYIEIFQVVIFMLEVINFACHVNAFTGFCAAFVLFIIIATDLTRRRIK
jgi:hypothetical protein